MKLLSFVRLFGENWGHKHTNRKRLTRRPVSARRSSGSRPWLEALEDRTLLSTLPPPIIPYSGHQFLPAGGFVNDNTPVVAVDPVDPSKVFAAYQTTFVDRNGVVFSLIAGAFSTNYGRTWLPVAMPLPLVNPSDPMGFPFQQATDPGVAFDRNENIYVVHAEHDAIPAFPATPNPIPNNTLPSAIVLQKFSFNGVAPTPVNLPNHIGVPFNAPSGSQVIFENGGEGLSVDLALSPTIAVDTNPAAFTDPVTRVAQNDPASNAIYVTWTTIDNHRSNASAAILVAVSSDGGKSFSAQRRHRRRPNSRRFRDGGVGRLRRPWQHRGELDTG